MLRFSLLSLAVMSFCFVTPVLKAEDTPKGGNVETAIGVVQSVDQDKMTFVLVNGKTELAVTCDQNTKFFDSQGREATMAKVVKVKAKLKVTHTGGRASKVEVG